MIKDTRPQMGEQNAETGELIYRRMNDAEFAQFEIDTEIRLAREAAAEAKATAKAALLARLGISEAEAKLLLA